MRKHNVKFASRWQRTRDKSGKLDRSNFPQHMAHEFVQNKAGQVFANRTLAVLLERAGAVRVENVL